MPFTHSFKSSDTDAPRISGTAGDLTNFFDKVLVDGYNSKTVTITRSGTTATLNCTGHGFRNGQILVVAGADQSDYNITGRCTYTDANNVTMQVANSPATPATGTITAKVAPVGWSTAYTGTNLRTYAQPAGYNGFYFAVDDTTTTYARTRFFETASAAGPAAANGTGDTPTDTQMSGGGYIFKASSANTTAMNWVLFGSGGFFILAIEPWGGGYCWSFWGDCVPYDAADLYLTIHMGWATSADYANKACMVNGANPGYDSTASWNGCYVVRSHLQTGESVKVATFADKSAQSGQTVWGTGTYTTYPSAIRGGILLSRAEAWEPARWTDGVRGFLPGVWNHQHTDASSPAVGSTFSGAAGTNLAGKSFEMFFVGTSGYGNGKIVIETSDTWYG